MSRARAGAAAVLLSDGRVLIAGGSDSNGPVNSVDIFGTDGQVSNAQAMNSPRSSYAAALLQDGRVLVTGGVTSGGGITNSAEIYDPSADTWTLLTSVMMDARSGHTASLLSDGRVLLAGGQNASGAVSSLEIFDPTNSNFSSAGVMSSPRMNHGASVLTDGRVFIVAGSDGTNPLNTSDIYDPSTGSVSAGPNLSVPRTAASVTTTLDGKVVVIGGNNGSNDLASAEIFDPATGQFTLSASSLSTARSGHQSFMLPKNNSILVVGGSSSGNDLNSAELYYSWADTFQPTGAMSVARPGFAGSSLSLEGRLLAAGGTGLSSTELYGFATVKTDAADYPPGTQVNISGSGWQPGETVTLSLVEVPFYDSHGPYTTVADSNGNISDGSFVTDQYDASIRFYLTAVGTNSGVQAQNTFTDAPGDTTNTTVSCSPSSVTVNTGTTCTATVANTESGTPNGAPLGTVNWQFNATGTFTPSSSCTLVPGGGPATSQCQVTLTPTVAVNGNVKGNYNSSDNSKWKNSTSANFALQVTAPTDTTPPVITPNVVGTLGNNGWYTSNVSVTWNVTDPESTITSETGCSSTTVSADTSGTTLTCSATSAGGTSSQSVAIKRDATPPTGITGTASRAADHNGWYNSSVNITFTGTDSISGIANCTTTSYGGPDTSSASVTGSCTDNAGNTSSPVAFNFKFDATAPTAVSLSVTAGTAGANGWYTSDVTVHTSGTEDVSNPLTCTNDQSQTAETAGQSFNGSCTNDAGLTTNAPPLTVKLDKTGPTADLTVTAGTPGTNGWYTSDVTVHAGGADTISGPVTCTSDQVISTETAGTPVNGSCTNNAGLSTNATPLTVKLDKTPPVVTLGVTAGAAGTNGWYTSDVTVHTSGTENISNPISCGADQFQTTETTGATFNGSCTNDAGLVGHASPLVVKLDKTGPSASLSVTAGTLGDNGWYISDVTVHSSGSDSISTPVTCTADQFLTTDTTSQVFHGSCTNDAGLTTNAADLAVKLDKTAPTVSITPDRGADHNGWYNHALTFTNPGTDSTSGIASCTVPASYSGPDSGSASVSATCKDQAGNTGSGTFNFMYDATPPTSVTGVPNRGTDHNGWYNHAVDVVFTGSDATSGIDTCSTVNYSGPDTATAQVNGTCTDKAGNTSSPVASTSFKFDITPPTAALAVTAGTPGAHGWYTSDVTVTTSGSDTVSNPTTCTASQFQTTETIGAVFNGSCTNDAGLTTDATPLNVKLDKTPPTGVTLTPTGTLGLNGWYTSDVSIQTSGTETISNPIVCTANQSQTSDTTGQVFHGSCTNDAGLLANASDITIKRDATPPVLVLTFSPDSPDGLNGWWKTPSGVPYSWTCSDSTSGIDTSYNGGCPSPLSGTVTANGTTHFSGQVRDQAGNLSVQVVRDLELDNVAPVVTWNGAGDVCSLPGNAPWCRGTQTAAFTANDATSGLANPAQASFTQSTGTNGTAVLIASGTVMDHAGNISSGVSAGPYKIDSVAPTIAITNPANGANYLLNASIAASYSCNDATSGVATCTGPVANGANFNTNSVGSHTFTVNATDAAGNPATPLTYTYSILYANGGMCDGDAGHQILQPINVDYSSVFKWKSTVPAKFRVCDANGASIGTAGVVSNFRLTGAGIGTLGTVDEAVDSTTPDTAFRWDPTAQQWIFNIGTKTLSSDSTYQFTITLNDGSNIVFQFGLK